MGSHPTKGTCNDPSCSLHGVCHCGCGQETAIAAGNRNRMMVTGRPMAYRHAHAPGSAHGWTSREVYERVEMARQACRVPKERVIPLIRWLAKETGSNRAAANVAGMHASTLRSILYKSQLREVERSTARKIVKAVMAHRRRWKDLTPWDTWENEYTRSLTPQEEHFAKRNEPKRVRERAATRRRRAKETAA